MKRPYVLEHHAHDGVSITRHASKVAAHKVGQALRRQGAVVYAFSVVDYAKLRGVTL